MVTNPNLYNINDPLSHEILKGSWYQLVGCYCSSEVAQLQDRNLGGKSEQNLVWIVNLVELLHEVEVCPDIGRNLVELDPYLLNILQGATACNKVTVI